MWATGRRSSAMASKALSTRGFSTPLRLGGAWLSTMSAGFCNWRINWPVVAAEVNHWAVVPADEDANTFGAPFQIEAGFHFILNGEYYGGYLRSVGLAGGEAERLAKGAPTVNARYNPANPDSTAVFAEDNADNLPFRIISG